MVQNLNPMKPNMMKLLENKLGGIVKKEWLVTITICFNHPAYVDYMKSRMKQVLEEEDFDHLVVSIGSGVTHSGLIKEFLQYTDWKDLLNNRRKVHTITMSSIESTKKILNENKAGDLNNINIYKSPFEFNDFMEDYSVPFDCNEFWDKKMWYWLEENIESLDGKILFWNIGGSYKKSLNLN